MAGQDPPPAEGHHPVVAPPTEPLPEPSILLRVSIEPDGVELANPLLAVSRLLAGAGAHARVVGDERRFEVSIALADDDAATIDHAEAWVRWAVHHAGVRERRTGDETQVST